MSNFTVGESKKYGRLLRAHPNSPYKWVYEFEYKNEAGYSQQGKVIKQGSKEVETATVQIWKTF